MKEVAVGNLAVFVLCVSHTFAFRARPPQGLLTAAMYAGVI